MPKYILPQAGQVFSYQPRGYREKAYYLVVAVGPPPSEDWPGTNGISLRRLIDPLETFAEEGPVRWARRLDYWPHARWSRSMKDITLLPAEWTPETHYKRPRKTVTVDAQYYQALTQLHSAAVAWRKAENNSEEEFETLTDLLAALNVAEEQLHAVRQRET